MEHQQVTAAIHGVKSRHAVISDACRRSHGDRGAFEDAVKILQSEYIDLLRVGPWGHGASFHLVLTVDYPRGDGK